MRPLRLRRKPVAAWFHTRPHQLRLSGIFRSFGRRGHNSSGGLASFWEMDRRENLIDRGREGARSLQIQMGGIAHYLVIEQPRQGGSKRGHSNLYPCTFSSLPYLPVSRPLGRNWTIPETLPPCPSLPQGRCSGGLGHRNVASLAGESLQDQIRLAAMLNSTR